MNQTEDFEKKLLGIIKPEPKVEHSRFLKLPILNAQKSASLGVWLIAAPLFILACICMKILFTHQGSVWISFFETLAKLDDSGWGWFYGPMIILVFPVIAFVLNLLSIIRFQYNREQKDLMVTVRLKWGNIIILLLSTLILAAFMSYIFTENIHTN